MKSLRYFANRILMDSHDLRMMANEVAAGSHVISKMVPKRRGGTRNLLLPDASLGPVLKKSLEFFYLEKWSLPESAFGFIPGRSAVEHAANHLAQPQILHIDLRDFFSHVTADQIRTALEGRDFDADCVSVMGELFTVKDSLPQGFSTSPYLSNLVFVAADHRLGEIAASHGLNYSRYADDLVFSGSEPRKVIEEVTTLVESQGWLVNESKTRVERRGGKQYVAGLTVFDHERPRISRRLKRSYRLKAYLIEKYGYEQYLLNFGGEERNDTPRRLRGMARYMASVEPNVGIGLLKSFDKNIEDDFMPVSEPWDSQEIADIYDWN